MVKNNKKTAFSAIEIAIVLVFIGLLLAGIFFVKGNLFSKAKTNKIISATKYSVLKDMEGLAVWFDVATKESFKNSEMVEGGGISEWKNISPNNYGDFNVVQSTSDNQPKYLMDSKDNLPLISFNGSADGLYTTGNVYGYQLAQKNQVTIFSVQKYYDNNNATIGWGVNTNRLLFHAKYGLNDIIYFDFGDISSGGRINNFAPSNFNEDWKILTFVRRVDNNGQIRINGSDFLVSSMTDDFDVTDASVFIIGNGDSKTDLREVIIFKRELSASEIDEIEKYLSDKWNIDLD